MSDGVDSMTPDRLRAFGHAWNDHDVDAVMRLMTDDCTFYSSGGPELLGTAFVGQAAVRSAVEAFFAANPTAEFVDDVAVVAGNHGFTEWTLRTRGEDGEVQEVRGCDLFEFRDGLISVKNAFRKLR